MKKRKQTKRVKNNNEKMTITLVVILCLLVAISTYWIYAYNHKHSYFTDDKLISFKIDDYAEVKGNLVYLKNTNDYISSNFLNKQKEIINNKEVSNVVITKYLYKYILSVKISYIITSELSSYEEVLTINIDLKEDKELANDELLELASTSYTGIAEDIFNEYIKLGDETGTVIDAITNEELAYKEFNNNSYKYIIRIRESFPKENFLYIDNDEVHYLVNLQEVNKVCYLTHTDTNGIVIDREIGKLL